MMINLFVVDFQAYHRRRSTPKQQMIMTTCDKWVYTRVEVTKPLPTPHLCNLITSFPCLFKAPAFTYRVVYIGWFSSSLRGFLPVSRAQHHIRVCLVWVVCVCLGAYPEWVRVQIFIKVLDIDGLFLLGIGYCVY